MGYIIGMQRDIKLLGKQQQISDKLSELRRAHYRSLSSCENLHASYW